MRCVSPGRAKAIDHVINSAAKSLYMSGGTVHCPIVFRGPNGVAMGDRKSTRLNSSHSQISYAVFCLKKKKDKHSYKLFRTRIYRSVFVISYHVLVEMDRSHCWTFFPVRRCACSPRTASHPTTAFARP